MAAVGPADTRSVTMKRRFVTLDVFTTRPLAGNPLAVVLDAEGLDDPTMQAIAREFNLSETVFVFPATDSSSRARLRIFAPATELPFAGHPTVGTAVILGQLDGARQREFVLEENVGAIACRFRSTGTQSGWAAYTVPRTPSRQAAGPAADAMAGALGLSINDFDIERYPVERWSAGNPFSFVPIRSLDAMRRCAIELARFEKAFGSDSPAAAFLFCRETTDSGSAFHARMFAPYLGMLEDPATGSAVAAFAGYLAAHGRYADGEHILPIEQGYEMGRPSLMELTIEISGGKLTRAAIAGDAVVVTEGILQVGVQSVGNRDEPGSRTPHC